MLVNCEETCEALQQSISIAVMEHILSLIAVKKFFRNSFGFNVKFTFRVPVTVLLTQKYFHMENILPKIHYIIVMIITKANQNILHY